MRIIIELPRIRELVCAVDHLVERDVPCDREIFGVGLNYVLASRLLDNVLHVEDEPIILDAAIISLAELAVEEIVTMLHPFIVVKFFVIDSDGGVLITLLSPEVNHGHHIRPHGVVYKLLRLPVGSLRERFPKRARKGYP